MSRQHEFYTITDGAGNTLAFCHHCGAHSNLFPCDREEVEARLVRLEAALRFLLDIPGAEWVESGGRWIAAELVHACARKALG